MRARFATPALTLIVLGLSGILSLRSIHAAAPEAKSIPISAKRFSYSPSEVTLKQGETVTLVVHSEDVPHGLRVKELGIELKAGKGDTVQTTITPDKTGDFVGHCSTFCGSGHGAMTLTFHVVP